MLAGGGWLQLGRWGLKRRPERKGWLRQWPIPVKVQMVVTKAPETLNRNEFGVSWTEWEWSPYCNNVDPLIC